MINVLGSPKASNISVVKLTSILFFISVMPSLLMAYGAQSMSLGVTVISILSIAMAIFLFRKDSINLRFSRSNIIISILLFVFIVFHGMISLVLNQQFNFAKFIYSLIFIVAVYLGVYFWVYCIQSFSEKILEKAIFINYFLLLGMGFLSLTGYSPFFKEAIIPVLFFGETSHFALAFAPYFFAVNILSDFKRKYLLTLLTFMYVISAVPNVTLFIVLLISMIFVFSYKSIFFIAIAIIFLVIFKGDATYFVDRLNLFANDNYNLSALVYQSAFERAVLAISSTYGYGVGFQQFGFIGEQGLVADRLTTLGAEGLNQFDGGVVAAKFIAEFGVFALVALVAYMVYFFHLLKNLRFISFNVKDKIPMTRYIFFTSIYFSSFVCIFIRGTGYFSASGFLFLGSLIWLASNNIKGPLGLLDRSAGGD